MVNLSSWLRGEAIMDLLSGPEVPAADYVIKSIIISVWAPRHQASFSCGTERRQKSMHTHTHTHIYNSVGEKYIFDHFYQDHLQMKEYNPMGVNLHF